VRELAVEHAPGDGTALQAIAFGPGRHGSRLLRQMRHGHWVVSMLPTWDSNRAMPHALRAAGCRGRAVAAPLGLAGARELAQAGVALVLDPFGNAAGQATGQMAQHPASKESAA